MYGRFKIQTNSSIRHPEAITVTVAFLLTSTLLLSSCAEMNEGQQNTARGAGIGTVAGAVIGGITGGSRGAVTGAVLGAGAGAAGGYIWSRKMEEQKRSMEHATAGTGVAVTQTADNQLKLEVPSDVSFDVGRADIKANFRPILEKFAQVSPPIRVPRFASSVTPTPPAVMRLTNRCHCIAPKASSPISVIVERLRGG